MLVPVAFSFVEENEKEVQKDSFLLSIKYIELDHLHLLTGSWGKANPPTSGEREKVV